jgi:hypothetical protein
MTSSNRPNVGGLTVPYVVDDRRQPIDFRAHDGHVNKCGYNRRCGICGKPLPNGRAIAFIGPDDGRRCFADPWMHPDCARLAMQQCPFLKGRDWREQDDRGRDLLKTYHANMVLFTAPEGRAHRDHFGAWHFEALGELRKVAA